MAKGNPANPDGHRTSYLWERVWSREAWLDILARFIHVERPEKASPPLLENSNDNLPTSPSASKHSSRMTRRRGGSGSTA